MQAQSGLGSFFACGVADGIHGKGWRNVGAAAVEDVGVNVDGVAMAAAVLLLAAEVMMMWALTMLAALTVAVAVVSRIGVVEDGGGVDTLVAVVVVVEM